MTNAYPIPSVTVVMPAFNAAATIAEALRSVQMQSCRPGSIIVVDDASGDGTAEAAEMCLRGGGIPYQVIRQARNRGPAAARNAGIRAADGDWIAFLDADDAWLPEKLALQLAVVDIRNPPHTGNTEDAPGRCRPLARRDFALRNPVATSTVLVRKDVITAVGGFDEQFRGPEDYDLWLRIAAWAGESSPEGPVVFVCGGTLDATGNVELSRQVPESGSKTVLIPSRTWPMMRLNVPLVWYRVQEGSLSTNETSFLPQVLRVLDKAYGAGGALSGRRTRRQARAYQFASAAWAASANGRTGAGVKRLAQSLIAWPLPFYPETAGRWARVKVAVFMIRNRVRRK